MSGSADAIEKRIRTVPNALLLQLLVPVLLTVIFVFGGTFSDKRGLTLTGSMALPDNIRYLTGDSIDISQASADRFTAITELSQLKVNHGYVRLTFEVAPSAAEQRLYLKTNYAQMRISVNGEELSDDMTLTDTFSNRTRRVITLSPSENAYNFDIVMKAAFAPDIRIGILGQKTWLLSLVGEAAAIVLWPLLLITTLVIAVTGRKRHGSIYGKSLPAVILLFVSTAFTLYAQFAGGWQKQLSTLGFLIMGGCGLFLLYCVLANLQAPQTVRDRLIAAGVVIYAVILPFSSAQFEIFLIRLFGMYYLFAVGVCCYYSVKKRAEVSLISPDGCCFILYMFFYLSQWLFFVGFSYTGIFFWMQLCFPVLSAVCLKILSVFRYSKASNKANNIRLMAFRPHDIGRLNDLLELFLHEPEFCCHSRNVSLYVNEICLKCGMTPEQSDEIAQAAFLHDIGKMMLPKSMLLKDGKLTNDEYEQTKLHTKYGGELFAGCDDDMLKIAKIIALQHHERYDGNGYYGLGGDEINKYAQIVSIADVFDAATTRRSYKKPWTFDEGYNYITEHSGTLFNERYVNAFSDAREAVYKIYCDTRE